MNNNLLLISTGACLVDPYANNLILRRNIFQRPIEEFSDSNFMVNGKKSQHGQWKNSVEIRKLYQGSPSNIASNPLHSADP